MAERTFHVLDYVVFGLMLMISAAIGIYHGCTGGKQRTTSEYLLGNRSMKTFPIAISLLASYLSAITLLGVPSEIFTYGAQYSVLLLSYFGLTATAAIIFAPIFHRLQLTSAHEVSDCVFLFFSMLRDVTKIDACIMTINLLRQRCKDLEACSKLCNTLWQQCCVKRCRQKSCRVTSPRTKMLLLSQILAEKFEKCQHSKRRKITKSSPELAGAWRSNYTESCFSGRSEGRSRRFILFDIDRNIKRCVYCRCGKQSLTFRAKAVSSERKAYARNSRFCFQYRQYTDKTSNRSNLFTRATSIAQ